MTETTSTNLPSLIHEARKYNVESLASFYKEKEGTTLSHGVAGQDLLLPDAKDHKGVQIFGRKGDAWTDRLLTSVSRVKTARIKTRLATPPEEFGRARGYKKGDEKLQNIVTLLTRETYPATAYVKHHLDRDDIIDVKDSGDLQSLYSVISSALRVDIAKAILVEDTRPEGIQYASGPAASGIRAIATEDPIYSLQSTFPIENDFDHEDLADLFETVINLRAEYEGSGNLVAFMAPKFLAMLMTLQNTHGEFLLSSRNELMDRLGVNEIVEVTYLNNYNLDPTAEKPFMIMVDPSDYTLGLDRGGEITRFEDFDLDFNKQKYLVETRLSGALSRPLSAIVLNNGAPNQTPAPAEAPKVQGNKVVANASSDVEWTVLDNRGVELTPAVVGNLDIDWTQAPFKDVDMLEVAPKIKSASRGTHNLPTAIEGRVWVFAKPIGLLTVEDQNGSDPEPEEEVEDEPESKPTYH